MLGVCCHWLKSHVQPRTGNTVLINEMSERTLQLGRFQRGAYTDEQIRATYISNIKNLAAMIPKVSAAGIRLFRISSSLFPLADKVPRDTWDNAVVRAELQRAGAAAISRGIRLTTHPGQFCVISSDSDRVVENSFIELALHGWVFDAMGLPRSPHAAINIHGGKGDRHSRLVDGIRSLPQSVRSRLTLENDESAYSVVDLLPVYKETGVPIVWDSHHHTFNDGELTADEAFNVTQLTWPKGVIPLQHISNTEPSLLNGSFIDRRKHSDYIHHVPDCQLRGLRDDTIAVEVEAKHKNLSVDLMASMFNIPK